jgi:EpsI family protein
MKMKVSIRFWATVGLLAGAGFLAARFDQRVPEPLAVPLDQIDSRIAGWTQTKTEHLAPGVLRELAPTSYLSRYYEKNRESLGLFIAFYAQQRAGESMHSPKHCLPGGGWEIWKHGSALIPVNGTHEKVNMYSIQNGNQRLLMFYWYQSKDRIVASEYLGKILLAKDTLLTGRTSAAIARITIRDSPEAEAEGIAFASELIQKLQRCFGVRQAASKPL